MAKELIKVIIFIFSRLFCSQSITSKPRCRQMHCNGLGVLPARRRFSLWSTLFSLKDAVLLAVFSPMIPCLRNTCKIHGIHTFVCYYGEKSSCHVIITAKGCALLQSCDNHHSRRRTATTKQPDNFLFSSNSFAYCRSIVCLISYLCVFSKVAR